MQQINIHTAKTHLSTLVETTAAGEPFVVAKAGCPLVIVSPYAAPAPCSRIGFLKGLVSIPTDFDRMEAEEIPVMFEGSRSSIANN